MPIYAYRCESCGHAKDVLQKVSDPLLTTCPACHVEAFKKQLTAAGFQLKGSGWYVTDFRNGNANAKAEPVAGDPSIVPKTDGSASDSAKTDAPKTDAPKTESTTAPASSTASTTSSSDSGPSGGSGSSSASV
jgi:putative FmdB family regulatory protein